MPGAQDIDPNAYCNGDSYKGCFKANGNWCKDNCRDINGNFYPVSQYYCRNPTNAPPAPQPIRQPPPTPPPPPPPQPTYTAPCTNYGGFGSPGWNNCFQFLLNDPASLQKQQNDLQRAGFNTGNITTTSLVFRDSNGRQTDANGRYI